MIIFLHFAHARFHIFAFALFRRLRCLFAYLLIYLLLIFAHSLRLMLQDAYERARFIFRASPCCCHARVRAIFLLRFIMLYDAAAMRGARQDDARDAFCPCHDARAPPRAMPFFACFCAMSALMMMRGFRERERGAYDERCFLRAMRLLIFARDIFARAIFITYAPRALILL